MRVLTYGVVWGIAAIVAGAAPAHAEDGGRGKSLTYTQVIKIREQQGELAPIVRIVSPLADAAVTAGDGAVGAGTLNGTGFALNLEVVTRDEVAVAVKKALNIRHTDQLGRPNPDFPGLFVFFDTDLVTPGGTIIPKNTNLGSLFNVAGTDDTPGPGVTIWAGWHVLESLPPDVDQVSITAAVMDEAGRIGLDRITVPVRRDGAASGQALTPAPSPVAGDGLDDPDGPEVTMIAPRVPTAVSTGPAGTPLPPAGALFFIQVTALDRAGAGIGVKEGVILDGSQIPNPAVNPVGGPNRNYPGLVLTLDVPLRQPNGNLVAAGVNLAPIFNIAGSEYDVSGAVRTVADWVVGGSLELPPGKQTVTITARVTDNVGRTGSVRHVVAISAVRDGQHLTPQP